jgi:hypothetical protein
MMRIMRTLARALAQAVGGFLAGMTVFVVALNVIALASRSLHHF